MSTLDRAADDSTPDVALQQMAFRISMNAERRALAARVAIYEDGAADRRTLRYAAAVKRRDALAVRIATIRASS